MKWLTVLSCACIIGAVAFLGFAGVTGNLRPSYSLDRTIDIDVAQKPARLPKSSEPARRS